MLVLGAVRANGNIDIWHKLSQQQAVAAAAAAAAALTLHRIP